MENKFILFLLWIVTLIVIMLLPVTSAYLIEELNFYDICFKVNIFILITTPLYYIVNYFIERVKLNKIEKDLVPHKIEIEYFRDIINNYSPGILSLIHDGKIFYDKDLMLSILYLQHKGYISIDNNVIRLTGKNPINLNENLIIILQNYDLFLNEDLSVKIDGQKVLTKAGIFHKNWPASIYKGAVNEQLVIERKEKNHIIRYLLSIILVIEGIIFLFSGENEEMWLFAFFLAFLTFILKYLSFAWNQYPKTAKGYEIYAKLKGLENFIKDFSKLSEREIEEIKLWDDYLIYAIMFNKASDLNKDAWDFYKNLKKEANKNLSNQNNIN